MVSVIIVNWNTLSLVKNLVTNILKQSKKVATEIVVVDNGSGDEFLGWVNNFPQIIHYELEKNMGYGVAANIGILISHGRYVLLVNPDVELPEGFFDTMSEFLDHSSGIGLLAPSSNNVWGAKGQHQENNKGRIVEILDGFIPFVCVMIPKRIFQEIGLIGLKYGEDVDFSKRLRSKNYRIVVIGDLCVNHGFGSSFLANNIGLEYKDQIQYVKNEVEPRFLGE